jgi:hypothetical protein
VNASPRGSDSLRREGMEYGGANTASSSSGSARGSTRAQELGFDLDGLPDSAWQTATTLPAPDTGTPAPAQRIEDDAPQTGVAIRPDVAQELDALLDQVTRNAPRALEARKAQ